MNPNSPEWNSDGLSLNLPAEGLAAGLRIRSRALFAGLDLRGSGNDRNKVTTEFDFDAEYTGITIQNGDKILLTPAHCFVVAIAGGSIEADAFTLDPRPQFILTAITNKETLHTDYLTMPRAASRKHMQKWTNSVIKFSLIRSNADPVLSDLVEDAEHAFAYAHYLYLRSLESSLLVTDYYWQESQFVEVVGIADISFELTQAENKADFPQPEFYPAPPGMPQETANGMARRVQATWQADAPSGNLIALIKRGQNYFYVWQR